MTIKATVHFLDGQILEKEFMLVEHKQYTDIINPQEEILRIWLEHASWVKMPDNTFLPASRIQKVTWVEVPADE